MLSYLVDETQLHICGNNPDCSAIEIETGTFKIKGYDGPSLECDKCGAEMQLKSGRFGKYFGCVECSNTRKLLRNGEPAPPKADPVPMPELRCEKVEDHYLLQRRRFRHFPSRQPVSEALGNPCAAGRRNQTSRQ